MSKIKVLNNVIWARVDEMLKENKNGWRYTWEYAKTENNKNLYDVYIME